MSYVRELPLDEMNYPPFAQIKNAFRFSLNFFRLQSMRRGLIEAEIQLTGTILTKEGALTHKEYIFLECSAANLSRSCVTAHCGILRMLGVAGPKPEQIALDPTSTRLPIVTKALPNFAAK